MIHNRRSVSILVVLGLCTLAASAIGAHWLFGSMPAGAPPVATGRNTLPPGVSSGAVCFGYVDLEHGTTSLYPLQPGRVAEVLVHENDRVEAGTPLLALEDGAARSRVDEARAAVAAAQQQLAHARKQPQRHQVRLAMQQAAIEAVDKRLSAARHLFDRKKELEKSTLLNPKEVAAAADEIKELQALREVETQKLAELKLTDPLVDVQRAEAETALMEAKLRQAEQALAECTLKAPRAGTVARILVTPGEVLGMPPRQPALIFAAQEPRIVRAEIEQEFAGQVAVGQTVRLQDDTNASLTCSGRVTRISDWYLQRRTVFQEPVRYNDTRTIECIIALDRNHPPLRIGQRVRVMFGPAGS